MGDHPKRAPTANELLANPIVLRALDEAWADSQVDDATRRHEEGGWVYMDVATRAVAIRRAAPGRQTAVDLSSPPLIEGCVVVGKYHTHPNPSSEGWNPRPSASDSSIDERHGVPDLVRADSGVYLSGPDSRCGGLSGEPGYPA